MVACAWDRAAVILIFLIWGVDHDVVVRGGLDRRSHLLVDRASVKQSGSQIGSQMSEHEHIVQVVSTLRSNPRHLLNAAHNDTFYTHDTT